jgi:hypothetical protein
VSLSLSRRTALSLVEVVGKKAVRGEKVLGGARDKDKDPRPHGGVR